MADLGIIDNYIVKICTEHKTKSAMKIPDTCIMKETFEQDTLILARLLEQSFPETVDPDLFKHIYYLCVFKVFEDEPDLLHEALIEIGASKKTKKFVERNLKFYKNFMDSNFDQKQLVKAAKKDHGFLTVFAAVESYINDQSKKMDQELTMDE